MPLPLLLTLGTGPKKGDNIQYGVCCFFKLPPNRCLQKTIQNKPNAISLSSNTYQEPDTVLCFAIGTVWYVSLFCPLLNAWHSSALKVSSHFTHEITQYFQRSLMCSQGAFGTPMSFLYSPGTTYVLSYTK